MPPKIDVATRELIIQRYLEGRSNSEIAKECKVSEAFVNELEQQLREGKFRGLEFAGDYLKEFWALFNELTRSRANATEALFGAGLLRRLLEIGVKLGELDLAVKTLVRLRDPMFSPKEFLSIGTRLAALEEARGVKFEKLIEDYEHTDQAVRDLQLLADRLRREVEDSGRRAEAVNALLRTRLKTAKDLRRLGVTVQNLKALVRAAARLKGRGHDPEGLIAALALRSKAEDNGLTLDRAAYLFSFFDEAAKWGLSNDLLEQIALSLASYGEHVSDRADKLRDAIASWSTLEAAVNRKRVELREVDAELAPKGTELRLFRDSRRYLIMETEAVAKKLAEMEAEELRLRAVTKERQSEDSQVARLKERKDALESETNALDGRLSPVRDAEQRIPSATYGIPRPNLRSRVTQKYLIPTGQRRSNPRPMRRRLHGQGAEESPTTSRKPDLDQGFGPKEG